MDKDQDQIPVAPLTNDASSEELTADELDVVAGGETVNGSMCFCGRDPE